jgi:endoglucanase
MPDCQSPNTSKVVLTVSHATGYLRQVVQRLPRERSMKPNVYRYLLCLLGAFVAVTGGCTPFGTRPESDKPPSYKGCGPDGLIDDYEDNNNQITVFEDRGGYYYTYADKLGSKIWPEQGDNGGTFTISEGGNGSKYAINMKGKLANASVVYAGMGLDFRDPKEAFDASRFEGITFFAKRGSGSTAKLFAKLPDGNTDPTGEVCSACYNDFNAELNLGEQWKRYVLPFRDLRQEGTWGAPRRPHIDRSKLFAIHWEVKTSGADFDIWVDDVAFVCKG